MNQLKKYVVAKYWMPGSFLAETTSKKLDSWDLDEAVEKAPDKGPYGPGAYAFELIQYVTTNVEGFEVIPKEIAHSGTYFLGGTIYTIDDIKREVPNSSILISNMEGNGWLKVIKTNCGTFQPFTEKDRIYTK